MPRSFEYYLDKVSNLYHEKPRFMASLILALSPYIDAQKLLEAIRDGYDVDTAIGNQLDVIGLYVGASRDVDIPLSGQFFSWRARGVSWRQGHWKNSQDPGSKLYKLNDDMFRLYIKFAIGRNQWDGTKHHAYQIYKTICLKQCLAVKIDDGEPMLIKYQFGNVDNSIIKSMIDAHLLILKPAGVAVKIEYT